MRDLLSKDSILIVDYEGLCAAGLNAFSLHSPRGLITPLAHRVYFNMGNPVLRAGSFTSFQVDES
jgi:hypothetical protein